MATNLVLTDQDSGTRDHPITWCAFPGEKPMLSGGCIIDEWEFDSGIGYGCVNILAIRSIGEEKHTLWLARETFDLDLPPWFMCVPLSENSRYINR